MDWKVCFVPNGNITQETVIFDRRATAVIGPAIESLPLFLFAAVPAAYAIMHPVEVGKGVGQLDVSMLLAGLASGIH